MSLDVHPGLLEHHPPVTLMRCVRRCLRYKHHPMPMTIDQAFATAIAHHQAGRWVEASQLYRQILAQHPNHPDALHLLGLLARRSGDEKLALQLISQAILVRPNAPEYHNNLGISLMHLAKPAEAVHAFRQATRLAPNYAEAHNNLGNALNKLEEFSAAIESFQKTIALQPNIAGAHAQLGEVLYRLGRVEEGILSLRRSLALSPGNVDALMHLGTALANCGKLPEAEKVLRQITDLRPDLAAGWTNLGNTLRVQAKPDEALQAFQQAVKVEPNFAAAYSNMGNALKDRGEIEEAIIAFRRAVELDPTSADTHSNLVYATCFSPEYNAAQLLAEARAWADRFEKPLLDSHRPFEMDRTPNRRLKIGYVSMDFRAHVVGKNVLPIIERHNRRRFEIHCFSVVPAPDGLTQCFMDAAERWHECAGITSAVLAEKIRAERIDILIELSLHMAGHRLLCLARKPAPIQVTWAGYPGTTGLSSIDYRLTDPYLDPPGENDEFYSEKSIRLPHSFWCYRPIEPCPDVNALPALDAGYVTFGCLNNFAKVTHQTIELWGRVLSQVRTSHLLILCTSSSARRTMLEYFHSQGIAGDRIEFVGMTPALDHMVRYQQMDICLDPLPYTGHTSTIDALWMGVPVVTLSGNTSLARGSVTALSNVGLTGLIAHTPGQYVQIAANLAADFPRLQKLRAELRGTLQASPICDEAGFTRNVEAAYELMWKRFCSRQPTPAIE